MVDHRIRPGQGFALKSISSALLCGGALSLFLAGCLDLSAPEKAPLENELAVSAATTTTLQAENAVVVGALKLSANTGYTGTGYVDYQNAGTDYIEWTVSIATAGTYELRFRYANGSTNLRPLKITQRHSTTTTWSTIVTSLPFPGTGTWSTWGTIAPKYNFSKTGTYKVRATATGASGPNIDYLQVYGTVGSNTAPSITTQPSSKSVAAGGSATFTVAASGTSPLTYQWQRNGTSISGATSASYTRSNIQSTDNGSTYRCVVKNAYGTATSNSATLSVTSGGGTWFKANLTWFTSYPDPGSDECINYNGCQWAGYFAGVNGKMSEDWVRSHNILAVHEKDFSKYRLKTLRVKQGTRQIDGVVYDMCSDSDCDGCCTRNANANGYGFLIDMESYTKARFGSGSGTVEWQCLNCN